MSSCAVIIPVYNAGRFLTATLHSVLEQTRRPDEIVVVDDGSTDDSASIAQSMGSAVTVIRQANRGESTARNVGLHRTQSDYVVFVDADDLLASESIAHFIGAIDRAPGVVAVMGTAMFTEDPAVTFDRNLPQDDSFFPTIVRTNFGPPHCWCTPRDLALSVGGFREDLCLSEDWEFWARIALTGVRLVPVPYVGALYRRHAGSQVSMSPKPAVFKARLLVCETLAAGVLERPELLDRQAHVLFWSLDAMLRQARRGGVAPNELLRAEDLLRQIARRHPSALKPSMFAAAVRVLGARTANRLRDLVGSPSE